MEAHEKYTRPFFDTSDLYPEKKRQEHGFQAYKIRVLFRGIDDVHFLCLGVHWFRCFSLLLIIFSAQNLIR